MENIAAAKTVIQNDLALVNAKMGQAESTIKRLPDDQQDLLKITRKYDLAESIFNTFLAKRNEANIVKAANLSDIHFIDSAKDTGGGLIGPKTSVNYVLALFLGLMIPLVVVFIITFMDNSIHTVEDIAKLTKIPLLGVIGKRKWRAIWLFLKNQNRHWRNLSVPSGHRYNSCIKNKIFQEQKH